MKHQSMFFFWLIVDAGGKFLLPKPVAVIKIISNFRTNLTYYNFTLKDLFLTRNLEGLRFKLIPHMHLEIPILRSSDNYQSRTRVYFIARDLICWISRGIFISLRGSRVLSGLERHDFYRTPFITI